jgi:hypothetical protein
MSIMPSSHPFNAADGQSGQREPGETEQQVKNVCHGSCPGCFTCPTWATDP